jgi:hypothetical protein
MCHVGWGCKVYRLENKHIGEGVVAARSFDPCRMEICATVVRAWRGCANWSS